MLKSLLEEESDLVVFMFREDNRSDRYLCAPLKCTRTHLKAFSLGWTRLSCIQWTSWTRRLTRRTWRWCPSTWPASRRSTASTDCHFSSISTATSQGSLTVSEVPVHRNWQSVLTSGDMGDEAEFTKFIMESLTKSDIEEVNGDILDRCVIDNFKVIDHLNVQLFLSVWWRDCQTSQPSSSTPRSPRMWRSWASWRTSTTTATTTGSPSSRLKMWPRPTMSTAWTLCLHFSTGKMVGKQFFFVCFFSHILQISGVPGVYSGDMSDPKVQFNWANRNIAWSSLFESQVVLEWLVHSKSGDNIELVTEEILEDMVDKWVFPLMVENSLGNKPTFASSLTPHEL